ncbi:PHB depolymerase family esterase [Cupriavidus sp. UGS-1]|uniref:extracellular catalytic domain type 1 short-chain-length polyhydroxyalkanoate depolymerase n=1 Tax=Cupriavidus sp. UGS-1 TaxID=2899826 RepID=UPI001E37F15D|nr:PHB depolymerase family esterase [Cupriavidus sp. UGS-1]MCD9120970.1 PHB depolymerase family esterase [Cupriavidus sp. UGS-1]
MGNWQRPWRQMGTLPRQSARHLGSWFDRLHGRGTAAPAARLRVAPPLALPAGPLPGQWSQRRLKLPAMPGELVSQLNYWLYEPSRRHAGPLPLVVMLHGCRQTAEDFAAGTRMNALAEREGFLVAYAEQPLRRQLQRCWQWFDLAASEGAREAQAIAALIDALALRRDVCPQRVYLAGLSAGAAMGAVVALRYPDKVAAVGLHSGVVVGAADSARSGLRAMQHGSRAEPATLLDAAGVALAGKPMPALILHGMDDQVVHPVNARLLARQFLAYNRLPDRIDGERRNGAPLPAADASASQQHGRANGEVDAADVPAGHYLESRFGHARRELVQLCEVAGLGHAWSGGDPAYRYHSDTGPAASMLMWEFFREHRR